MIKFIKEKVLNWCLSAESVQIGELYSRYKSTNIHSYDNEKLKFIEQCLDPKLLIQTPTKISPIKRLLKTVKYGVYTIQLENGLSIECADTHILIDRYDKEVYAINSLGHILKTELGLSKVISVDYLNYSDTMYDIEIDGIDHRYYTNRILSHNTTLAAAYFLWFASFHDDKTILIVSNNMGNASEFIHRVRGMYEEVPKWLKPGLQSDGWNKQSCGFDNKSRIISRATSESSARGLSLSLVFADELAFVRDNIQEEFWTALSPTLSTGGSLIVASTPDGDNNLFARLAREAENGLNEFQYFKYIWSDIPGRDEAWKKSEISRIGPEKFLQEHECHRISSGSILVSTMTLQKVVHPIKPIHEVRSFKIFKEFIKGKYIIGVDPSTGSGKDFSVIEVFEFPSMEQVAEFRDNVSSSPLLYKALKSVIKMVESKGGEIYYSVEANGIGEGLLALLENDEHAPENAEFITQDKSNRPGFTTTNRAKMKACLTLRDMIEDGTIKINSEAVLTELKNYIRTRKGYEAKEGATDDAISAILIVIRILDQIIQFDDDAFEMMANKMEGDYFNEGDYNANSDDAAMPLVF